MICFLLLRMSLCLNDKCFYVRRKTVKSLGELAKVNPEEYIKLYKQGL